MSAYAFRRCLHGDPVYFCRSGLALLSGDELSGLCEAMGIPFGGTIAQKIDRLMDARELREILAPYVTPEGDHAGTVAVCSQLAADYKGRELRAYCKRAGTYAGGTKFGMAAALLQWRNACRRRGCEAVRLAQEARRASGRPHQIEMHF